MEIPQDGAGVSGLPSPRLRAAAAALATVILLLPVLVVRFPPSTDLPQHLAQIRLAHDARHDPSSPYSVQWTAPNTLVYSLAEAAWAVGGPLAAGPILVGLLVALWAAGVALLAARTRAPVESAVFASLLTFNHAFYWGFANFIVGFPVFAVFVTLAAGADGRGNRLVRSAALSLAAVVLLWAHALWFAAGALWFAVRGLGGRDRLPRKIPRLAPLLPAAAVAGLWYPALSGSRSAMGFDMAPLWVSNPLARLSPKVFVDGAWGGIRGPAEPILLGILVLWIAFGFRPWRRVPKPEIRPSLLVIALAFIALALVLPDKFQNTGAFASRWLPCGLTLLLLAAPSPFRRPRAGIVASLLLLAVFSGATVRAWRLYETRELRGLAGALAALPEAPRLLGLDYVQRSDYVKGRPFLQLFAMGQVMRGGTLNFTFVEHGSGIVGYRGPAPRKPWTRGLEWRPELLRRSDLAWFDVVLAHGDEALQSQLAALPGLSPAGGEGRWRLYRVEAAIR